MLVQALTEENNVMERRLKQAEEEAKQLAHQMQMLTEKFTADEQARRPEDNVSEHPDQVFDLNICFFIVDPYLVLSCRNVIVSSHSTTTRR